MPRPVSEQYTYRPLVITVTYSYLQFLTYINVPHTKFANSLGRHNCLTIRDVPAAVVLSHFMN